MDAATCSHAHHCTRTQVYGGHPPHAHAADEAVSWRRETALPPTAGGPGSMSGSGPMAARLTAAYASNTGVPGSPLRPDRERGGPGEGPAGLRTQSAMMPSAWRALPQLRRGGGMGPGSGAPGTPGANEQPNSPFHLGSAGVHGPRVSDQQCVCELLFWSASAQY